MAATNSLAGVNLAQIAQETAETLLPKLAPISYMLLDLSNDIRESGESVTSRVVTSFTAQDVSAGYSAAVQNVTTTAITVTLNQHYGTPASFTDAQAAKASVDLQGMVYQPLANSLAYNVLAYVFGLVTSGSYSQVVTTASASFDSDVLSDLTTTLNKAYVPDSPRLFVGNSDVFNALRKDVSFKAAYASGTTETLRSGIVSRGMGADLLELSWLPSNSGTNLNALMMGKFAIAFAARRLPDPPAWYGEVENITVAGIPIQWRRWYDGNAGLLYIMPTLLYGASVAVSNYLVRSASA